MNLLTASKRELSSIKSFVHFEPENVHLGKPDYFTPVVSGSIVVDRKNETVTFTNEHDEQVTINVADIVVIGV